MKKSLRIIAPLAGVSILLALLALFPRQFPGGDFVIKKLQGKATISDRVNQYGSQVEARWHPFFQSAGVSWPPQKVVLVGLKQEKQLEVYAANNGALLRFIRAYPVLAASGKIGPKLREGDFQVPEGIYGVESLNPNSAFHLALRVSYPSEQDRAQATSEGRTNLGGDIMIHGSNASVGCLAMGDQAAEDIFVLAAQTGIENIEVLLCPLDFRKTKISSTPERPEWVKERYAELAAKLDALPQR